MKDHDLHTFIESFDVSSIRTTAQQEKLKYTLLKEASRIQSASQKEKIKNYSSYFFIPTFMKNFKLITSITIATVLTAIIGYVLAPSVMASQLIESGLAKIATLSSVEQAEMTESLGFDSGDLLLEAKEANDHKRISRNEFERESKNANHAIVRAARTMQEGISIAKGGMPTDGAQTIDEATSFIRYTNRYGSLVFMALDSENLPIAIAVKK